MSWNQDGEGADWSKLIEALETWRRVAEARQGEEPFLKYHDLGETLLIEDRRREFKTHVLGPAQRHLYLLCTQIRHRSEIRCHTVFESERSCRDALDDLVAKRLMYRHGERYLSLAVAPDPRSAARRIRKQHALRHQTPEPAAVLDLA